MNVDGCTPQDALSDKELVRLVKGGDVSAFSVLSDRYMPIVRHRAGRYCRVVGADQEDFLQEGMLALFRAAKGYDSQTGNQFNTYAITCINNSINTAVRLHIKNSPELTSVCIDEVDEHRLYKEAPFYSQAKPAEDICIDRETSDFREQKIETLLTDFERHVLRLYLSGYSYRQISQTLSTATKAVDNALQRVRKKLRPEL